MAVRPVVCSRTGTGSRVYHWPQAFSSTIYYSIVARAAVYLREGMA